MVVAPRDCCCLLLYDAFERSGDDLDADGVNVPGGVRYVDFADGDWLVSGGALVAQATDSPIYFCRVPGVPRLYSTTVFVTLAAIGDWAEIRCGDDGVTVRIEGIAQGVRWSYDGHTFEEVAPTNVYPLERILTAKLFAGDLFPGFRRYPVPDVPADVVDIGSVRCLYFDGEFPAGGFDSYALAASAGTKFDDLTVIRATADCQELLVSCARVCWPELPATIVLSIAGLVDGKRPCDHGFASSCWSLCASDYLACAAAAVDAAALCACRQARADCEIACLEEQWGTACIVWAPCSAMNGAVVLDRVQVHGCGETLNCKYQGEVTATRIASGSCSATEEATETIDAHLDVVSYDEESGVVMVRVRVVALGREWLSAPVDSEVFCTGDPIDLVTYSGLVPVTVYADEVSAFGRSCGDGTQTLFCDGSAEGVVFPEHAIIYSRPTSDCSGVECVEVLVCDETPHTAITVGPAQAT